MSHPHIPSTLDDPRMNQRVTQATGTRVFTQAGWEGFDSDKHDLGSFHGRAGTPKRSRKGRTYRAPNGVRKYHPWNPQEVIAYRKG
jgi:hypothetical protein